MSFELYDTDLSMLQEALNFVEPLSSIFGVKDVEIHVKGGDGYWAILGWGEAGDPCILRFVKSLVTDASITPISLVPQSFE